MDSKVYAIFLDIDDTLMARKIIPKENVTAIERVRELGHKVYLNTGRSYASIPDYVLSATEYDGVVAGIGAYVKVGDEVLKYEAIPNDVLVEVADHLLRTGRPSVFGGDQDLIYINYNGSKKGLSSIRTGSDFKTIYKDMPMLKATVNGILTDEDLSLLNKYFNVYQHGHYAEFGLKGSSKSSGMQVVLDHLSLPRENSVAIGDSVNDMDMLRSAGISVAMENADDKVKAICDFVTLSAEEAGVAAALTKIVLKD